MCSGTAYFYFTLELFRFLQLLAHAYCPSSVFVQHSEAQRSAAQRRAKVCVRAGPIEATFGRNLQFSGTFKFAMFRTSAVKLAKFVDMVYFPNVWNVFMSEVLGNLTCRDDFHRDFHFFACKYPKFRRKYRVKAGPRTRCGAHGCATFFTRRRNLSRTALSTCTLVSVCMM